MTYNTSKKLITIHVDRKYIHEEKPSASKKIRDLDPDEIFEAIKKIRNKSESYSLTSATQS